MIAEALGHRRRRARASPRRATNFAPIVVASLRATAAAHRIDYLAGSAELGDFDPTSSTIAFAPGGDARSFPRSSSTPTFERYWREFVARRDGAAAWKDYTPYELRNVGDVRAPGLARARARAARVLHGRPAPAGVEPVARGRRRAIRASAQFVGDLPHAWVASDYIRSVLDLFAYERGDGAMVLAGGIPAAWLDRAGVAIRGLRTPYGTVAYSLVAHRRADRRADVDRRADAFLPADSCLPVRGRVRCTRPSTANPSRSPATSFASTSCEAKVVLQFGR